MDLADNNGLKRFRDTTLIGPLNEIRNGEYWDRVKDVLREHNG